MVDLVDYGRGYGSNNSGYDAGFQYLKNTVLIKKYIKLTNEYCVRKKKKHQHFLIQGMTFKHGSLCGKVNDSGVFVAMLRQES